MYKAMVWGASLRSLLLSLRVIAFEQPKIAMMAVWTGPALLAVLVALMYSAQAALVTAALMGAVLLFLLQWAQANRYRLVRVGDRIEFADVTISEEEHVQQFSSGVVLKRMTRADAMRTAFFDAQLMENERWFFLVRSQKKMTMITLAWVINIELDEG